MKKYSKHPNRISNPYEEEEIEINENYLKKLTGKKIIASINVGPVKIGYRLIEPKDSIGYDH